MHVGANKTIIGVLARNATLQGGGCICIQGHQRGLSATSPLMASTEITLAFCLSNIWIDHCTFKNSKDGNPDINRASDNITVSAQISLRDRATPRLASLIGLE